MKCPYCNCVLPDGSSFCDKCGQAIPIKSTQSTASSSYWSEVEKQTTRDEKIRTAAENEFLRKQKQKRRTVLVSLILAGVVAAVIFYFVSVYPNQQYTNALTLLNSGKYHEAMAIFEDLGNYKDSSAQIGKCQEGITEQRYQEGVTQYQSGNYNEALQIFEELNPHRESQTYIYECYLKIAQSLVPTYSWDFSEALTENSGLTSTVHGNINIKEVLNSNIAAAAYFDGDGDYIECGQGINLTENFTFNILLCCQDVYKDYSAFFAKFEENGGPYAFSINQGHINLWITEDNGYHTEIESTTEIWNNEWYLVTIVKEGNNFKLYIDGKLDSEDSISSVHTGEDLVTIGRQALMFYPEDQLQFTGYIAEIAIYEQALTNKEITALFESIQASPNTNDSSIVEDIPEDALLWNDHYYAVFDNCKSWEEAAAYCESRGGHLATIASVEENNALFSYINQVGYESAYFGLSDTATEGSWGWVTGENTDYLNWHPNEPNGESSAEDYAMFYYKFSDGTWNDGEFGSGTANGGTAFICEWD